MLKSIAIIALLAAQGNAQTVTPCDTYTENFGSSSGEITISNQIEDFYVEDGSAATCTVTCDSGSGSTQLELEYGADCGFYPDADSGSQSGCNLVLSVVADGRQSSLGWSITSNDFTNLEMSCGCANSYEPGSSCFSGDTLVQVQAKGEVLMKDLQVGDRVLTAKNTYQPVYSFGHHSVNEKAEFYQIYTDEDAKKPLEMTGKHLIFVGGEAIPAERAQVGDKLIKSSGKATFVTKISKVTKKGLYMPLTPSGTIVVEDGLVASAYVSIKDDAPTTVDNIASFYGLSEHALLHWWLSPFRMMCMGVSSNYCDSVDSEEGILTWLIVGRSLARFVEPLGFGVGILVVGAPLYFIFAGFNMMESLMGGPAWAPLLMAVLVVGAAYGFSLRHRVVATQKKHV